MMELSQLIFEFRTCDKKLIKKMANHIVSVILEQLVAEPNVSSIPMSGRREIYDLAKIGFSQASLSKARMGCLLSALSEKLKLRLARENQNPLRASDIKYLSVLNQIHEYVVKEISETSAPSLEQSLQWAIYFLIVSSGACFKELADAVVEKIQHKKNPIEHVAQFDLIQLFYTKPSHFFNAKDDKGRQITERLLFIEPISLMAINGFRKRLEKADKSELVEESAFSILKPLLRRAYTATGVTALSQRQLYRTAAFRLMLNPESNMPQWQRFYADGTIQSSSMTLRSFKALVSGTCKAPSRTETYNADIVKTPRKRKKEKHASNQKPSEHPFISVVIEAIKCPTTKNFRPVNETKQRLKSLTAGDWSLAGEILLEWAIYELEHGKWNASSTVMRNLSAIGITWLLFSNDIELLDLDIDGASCLYDLIKEARKKQDANVLNALQSLFRFTNHRYSFPLPESLNDQNPNTMVVNTLPSEAHFRQLQIDIAVYFKNERDEIREAIHLMLILVRRLFLRPYEVVGIRIKDVSIYSTDSSLFVRRHPFIFVKTHSAVRRLPAHLLLKSDELALLQKFLTKRKNQADGSKNRLLFSIDPHHDVRFSSSTLSRPVTKLLTAYLGEHTPCYQLRHAGQSALQLVLFGSDELIEQLTPYTAKQAKKIREWLARDANNETLMQLSSLAGHLSSSITLSTYTHHTDLLLFQACCNLEAKYPLRFCQNLSSLRPSTLLKHAKQKTNVGHLSGSEVLQVLRSIQPSKASNALSPKQSDIKCQRVAIKEHQYCPEDCETVLKAYDRNSDNYFAAVTKCGLTPSWAANVVKASQDIKQYKKYFTARGKNSRLYPKNSLKLAPPAPQSLNEREYVTTIWKKLIEAPESTWSTLRKSVDYLFRQTSHGRSGVIFSSPSRLKEFLNDIIPILPSSAKWCLILEPNVGKKAIDPAIQQSKWKKKTRIDVTLAKRSNVTGLEEYPLGRASLHLLKPKVLQMELDKHSYSKYSTNALQYAAHIFAIYQRACELETETEE